MTEPNAVGGEPGASAPLPEELATAAPGQSAPEPEPASEPPALLACPTCGAEVTLGDLFCEACAAPLTAATPLSAPAPGCQNCHDSSGTDPDGYCLSCGYKAPLPRDHVEWEQGLLVAVTDRGIRHHRNEDAAWIGTAKGAGPTLSLVCVADGVSSSFDPDLASQLAVETAGESLLRAVGTGLAYERPLDALTAAAQAAGDAVAALIEEGDPRRRASNPACTLVLALVSPTHVHLAWIGDSRAYWLEPGTGLATALTEDDSFAQGLIDAGASIEVAMNDARAHAITAWLGADAPELAPHTRSFEPSGPGWLLVCSDGLWNYLDQPDAMGAAFEGWLAAPPLEAARAAVQFALSEGGQDNITVALASCPANQSAPTPTTVTVPTVNPKEPA